MAQFFWNTWKFLKSLNLKLPYNPVPLVGICPKEIKAHRVRKVGLHLGVCKIVYSGIIFNYCVIYLYYYYYFISLLMTYLSGNVFFHTNSCKPTFAHTACPTKPSAKTSTAAWFKTKAKITWMCINWQIKCVRSLQRNIIQQ